MPPVWQFLSCILFWLFVVIVPFFFFCSAGSSLPYRHYLVARKQRHYSLVMLCRLLIVVASLVPKHLLLVLIWGYCFLLSFFRPWLIYHSCMFTFGPDGAVGILLTPSLPFSACLSYPPSKIPPVLKLMLLKHTFCYPLVLVIFISGLVLKIFGSWLTNTTLCPYFCCNS